MKQKVFNVMVCFNLFFTFVLLLCWWFCSWDLETSKLPWDKRVSLNIPVSIIGVILYAIATFNIIAENFSELNIYQDYHRCIDYAERNVTKHFWKLMLLGLMPTLLLLVSVAITWINATAAMAVFFAGAILSFAASLWAGNIIAARS